MSEFDEISFLELLLPKTKPIIVGTCYRPPKQSNFIDRLENILSQLRADCEIIVMSDFNICVMDSSSYLYQACNRVNKLFDLKKLQELPTKQDLCSITFCVTQVKKSASQVLSVLGLVIIS